MIIYLVVLFTLAFLGPLFGAETRDGLDWARNNFWLRRRLDPYARRAGGPFSRPGGRRRASAVRSALEVVKWPF